MNVFLFIEMLEKFLFGFWGWDGVLGKICLIGIFSFFVNKLQIQKQCFLKYFINENNKSRLNMY